MDGRAINIWEAILRILSLVSSLQEMRGVFVCLTKGCCLVANLKRQGNTV